MESWKQGVSHPCLPQGPVGPMQHERLHDTLSGVTDVDQEGMLLGLIYLHK
jgi:hypothetical protein